MTEPIVTNSRKVAIIVKNIMLDKFGILVVIFILLLAFYFVISLAVYKKDKSNISKNVKNYLFNVRVLILFIGVVALILSFFM